MVLPCMNALGGLKAKFNLPVPKELKLGKNFSELIDEFYDKIAEVRKSDRWLKKIKNNLLDKLPSEKQYYEDFESILNDRIKR